MCGKARDLSVRTPRGRRLVTNLCSLPTSDHPAKNPADKGPVVAKAKPPYHEGDWFLVPIGDDRWVLGRVARHDGAHTVFGYFFAPALTAIPALEDGADLAARDAYTQLKFSDLEMRDGHWPILGQQCDFDREAWPMVEFESYLDAKGHRARLYAITYSDDDPNEAVASRRVALSERGQRPQDGLCGAKAAEIVLRKRLAAHEGLPDQPPKTQQGEPPRPAAVDPPGTLRHYLYAPDRSSARALTDELNSRGHDVELRAPGDGINEWRILVTDAERYTPEVLDRREQELMDLATAHGGEYDGNEIAL